VLERAQIRRLRIASLLEGFSLLLLVFVAVPAKHLFGHPLGVQVIGPVHGFFFVLFLWSLLVASSAGGWPRGEVVRLLLGSVLPFGAFMNAGLLRRKEEASGLSAETEADS
jgi:integral membrane protein